MQQHTLERRLDLLKLEGNGLLRPEIVKELAEKYECSKDTIWYDFRTKQNWQPILQEMRRALLKIVNRHDQIYRKATLSYIQANDDKSKIMALNLMRSLNKDAFDMLQSTGKIEKVAEKAEVTAKATIIWKAWKPDAESN